MKELERFKVSGCPFMVGNCKVIVGGVMTMDLKISLEHYAETLVSFYGSNEALRLFVLHIATCLYRPLQVVPLFNNVNVD